MDNLLFDDGSSNNNNNSSSSTSNKNIVPTSSTPTNAISSNCVTQHHFRYPVVLTRLHLSLSELIVMISSIFPIVVVQFYLIFHMLSHIWDALVFLSCLRFTTKMVEAIKR